jgi:hypothetical protein
MVTVVLSVVAIVLIALIDSPDVSCDLASGGEHDLI